MDLCRSCKKKLERRRLSKGAMMELILEWAGGTKGMYYSGQWNYKQTKSVFKFIAKLANKDIKEWFEN